MNPFSAHSPKVLPALFWKDICSLTFTSALSTIAKIWTQLVSKSWWLNKENILYVQDRIVHSLEWSLPWLWGKIKNDAICCHVHGSRGYHVEWRQLECDASYRMTLTYRWDIRITGSGRANGQRQQNQRVLLQNWISLVEGGAGLGLWEGSGHSGDGWGIVSNVFPKHYI